MGKEKTVEAGLKEGWTRATVIVRKEHWQEAKAVAANQGRLLKDILDEALDQYLQREAERDGRERISYLYRRRT